MKYICLAKSLKNEVALQLRNTPIITCWLKLFQSETLKPENGSKVEKYLRTVAPNDYSGDRILWFHVSSLGEFEQGRPVIEAIRKLKPEYKILLTFFSPSVMS